LPSSPDQRTLEPVRAQDWEAAIKDSYQPVEVAEGLWIVPTWSERATLARNTFTNEEEEDSSIVNLILEPGLAFGTGDHPTTRLCLKWLQALHIRNTSGAGKNSTVRVMDYGTGSGVLAVAALLLGATTAIGTDVEHLAVRSAAQNAALNNVGDRFTALQCGADLNAPEPMGENGYPAEERVFDIVVANILRGPLVELAPRLAAYAVSPGAVLGLSGILETQAPEVIEAYSPWFDDFEVKTEESWALITAKRK
jgi:ribosomal protein L11 methyltransferase